MGSESRFVALPPTRVLDTRNGIGAPAVKPGPDSTVVLHVTGVGGVPTSGVTAVALNVTATEATAPGWVQVFPTNQAAIGASSNLNVENEGQTIPNMVVVPVGDGGNVSIYTQSGTHLLADVLGYFVASGAATDGRYVAVAPTRLLDTRGDGNGVYLTNPGDVVNCSDFSTWDDANRWFWTYHRFGDPAHLDSNNDNIACETLPGAPSTAVQPVDLFKVAPGGTVKTLVRGVGPIPATGVSAIVLNVTAADATGPGFVQVIPTGGATPLGASSSLNVEHEGQAIPNLVVVPVGSDGTVTIYSQGGTHVVADVAGYFTNASAPSSTDGLFVPLRPERLLDTRNGIGAPAAKVGDNGSVVLTVAGRAGVPSVGVGAVFLNVTATETDGAGFVQVYPTGQAAAGSSSNLNPTHEGQTIPNAVFATLPSSGGTVTIYTLAGMHLLADVAGYFTATIAGGSL